MFALGWLTELVCGDIIIGHHCFLVKLDSAVGVEQIEKISVYFDFRKSE